MAPLECRNNKDKCCGNVTHGQPTSKRGFSRSYKRTVTFNLYFYREDLLINWFRLLIWLWDISNGTKSHLLCINLGNIWQI